MKDFKHMKIWLLTSFYFVLLQFTTVPRPLAGISDKNSTSIKYCDFLLKSRSVLNLKFHISFKIKNNQKITKNKEY